MSTTRMHRPRIAAVALGAVFALVVAGCTSSDGSAGSDDQPPSTEPSDAVGAEAEPASIWASDVPSRPSPGCEPSDPEAAKPGLSKEMFVHDEAERTYGLLVSERDDDAPMPLLVDLHGLGSNQKQERNLSGYDKLAERDGVVVIWPQGMGERPGWSTATGEENRDVAFVVDLVAATGKELCIDEARVYAAGISNGGLMSSALGCGYPDVFAAVAPVAGFQTVPDCDDPSSLLLFYGTHDAVLPWAGGVGPALGVLGSDEVPEIPEPEEPDMTADPGPFAPVPVNIIEWASQAGCAPERTEEAVSSEVQRWTYEGCSGGDVEVYVVENGGHSWPGNEGMAALDDPIVAAIVGHTTLDISATELAWEFFATHPQEG